MTQFIANGLCLGAIYGLVGLGFGLIYSASGVFHIAHGAVYAISAYVLWASLFYCNLPLIAAVPAALCLAVMMGLGIEFAIYRPLTRKRAPATVMMISSLGIYIVIVSVIAILAGNDAKFVRLPPGEPITLGHVILGHAQQLQLLVTGVGVLLYWLFLVRTSLGRRCRAVADDTDLASVIGISVENTRAAVFAIGSLLAAMASMLVAIDIGIDPSIGFPAVMVGAVAFVLGGLQRFIAPALGGLVLGLAQGVVIWRTSSRWANAATFGILVIVLLARPQGLLGRRQRVEEL